MCCFVVGNQDNFKFLSIMLNFISLISIKTILKTHYATSKKHPYVSHSFVIYKYK